MPPTRETSLVATGITETETTSQDDAALEYLGAPPRLKSALQRASSWATPVPQARRSSLVVDVLAQATAPTAPRNVYQVRPPSLHPCFRPSSRRRVLRARRRLVDNLEQQGRRLRPGARVDAVDAEEGYA